VLVERYASVALTTANLPRARLFWIEQLAFPVTEEDEDHFVVDAAGLRLRVDIADGDVHRGGSTDPVVGFEVASLAETLTELAERDVYAHRGPTEGSMGAYAELRDPDGRPVILTEIG
jgi:catechol 2,3-dioxygenase-like lactoylglutathione lyase family enzyme